MIIIRASARGTVPSGSVSRTDDMKRRSSAKLEESGSTLLSLVDSSEDSRYQDPRLVYEYVASP